MKALYLVAQAPGAFIDGVGFLVPGQYFEAPAEGYRPSRTFKALNQPASDALKALQAELLAKAKDYRGRSADQGLTPSRREAFADAADHIEDEAKAIDFTIAGKPAPEVKTDITMSLKALDEQERGIKGVKRAADK